MATKAAAEAGAVTHGAVRCSARLCEKSKKLIFGDELSMTYKRSSTTYVSSEDFSHSLALQRTAPRVTARAFCERSVSYIWASFVRATVGHAPRHAPPSLSLGSLGVATHSPNNEAS